MTEDKKALSIGFWNIGFLNSIFENENGIYSKDALLFQDILKYGLTQGRPRDFKFTEIARWLMSNNSEFREYYASSHDTMTNRIAKRRQRIQTALDQLQRLQLIVQTGVKKAERNDTETPVYDLTRSGYFMAALVHINDYKHKHSTKLTLNDAYDIFYEVLNILLEYTVSENSNTRAIIVKKLLQKIKEKSLIREFADEVIAKLHSTEQDYMLESIEEILTLLDFPHGLRALSKTSFLDLWKECVNELEADRKSTLLYSYKMQIETVWIPVDSFHQEKIRLENASNFSKAVVVIDCWRCKIRTCSLVDVVELLEAVFERRVKEGSQLLTGYKVSCPRCNSEDVLTWLLMPKKESSIIHTAPNWWKWPIEYDVKEYDVNSIKCISNLVASMNTESESFRSIFD